MLDARVGPAKPVLVGVGRVVLLGDVVAEQQVRQRLEAVRMVNKAIRSAGPKCKRIVRLYFGQEYSLADMTKATGYSKKTVWKRIWGCLDKMRKVLA